MGLLLTTADEVYSGGSTRPAARPLEAALAVGCADGNRDLPIRTLCHAA